MPPKRKKQEAKGRITTKKAKMNSLTQQNCGMSANDIQEVTINVIKKLKQQGLLRTDNQRSVRASATSHYDNVSSAASLLTRHSYNEDDVHFDL